MKITTPMTPEMGEHIRLARQSAGLTQAKLAWNADTTAAQVSLIEGGTPQSMPALERVCAFLGLEVEAGK